MKIRNAAVALVVGSGLALAPVASASAATTPLVKTPVAQKVALPPITKAPIVPLKKSAESAKKGYAETAVTPLKKSAEPLKKRSEPASIADSIQKVREWLR
jgi:hypothetical protein